MMQANSKNPLWRVEWTHRNGYQAPYQLIWAETRKEAIKKISSRLADFPKSWSYKIFEIKDGEKEEKRPRLRYRLKSSNV